MNLGMAIFGAMIYLIIFTEITFSPNDILLKALGDVAFKTSNAINNVHPDTLSTSQEMYLSLDL